MIRRRRLILPAALLGLFASLGDPAPAGRFPLRLAPDPAIAQEDSAEAARREQEEIRRRQAELEDIRRRARESREQATRLKGQERQAMGQLRRTERDLSSTRRRLKTLTRRRENLDMQLGITRLDLQRSLNSLTEARRKLSQRVRQIYMYGPARELEFLFSPVSFAQLMTRWDYMLMVAEQDRQLMEDVRDRKELVETLEHRLEGHLTQVERTQRQTSSENSRLARLRSQRQSTVRTIQTQREAYEAAAAELERTARDVQRLLARLEARRREAADRARAEGRPLAPYTGDFAKGQGSLDWPVQGNVVGRFGIESNPRFPNVKIPNNGIDIAAPVGSSVRAVAKGRVDYRNDDFGSYGPVVILNHGDGYYTLYAHLSDIGVAVGQEVQAGQVIGRSGETGSLKGPILHFEVRRGGSALNPESWLR
jgi:septal ring factor EnvC (AmiA/AmiB activator)